MSTIEEMICSQLSAEEVEGPISPGLCVPVDVSVVDTKDKQGSANELQENTRQHKASFIQCGKSL